MADLNMVTNLCESGDLEPLRDLLKGCPAGCCDGADSRGYIPLHTAVFNHRNRVAKFLLERKYSSPWFRFRATGPRLCTSPRTGPTFPR